MKGKLLEIFGRGGAGIGATGIGATMSATEWLINTDRLQSLHGARTGYVSDDVVHDSTGECKGHLGKRADPWE